jgi:hypothetical protein
MVASRAMLLLDCRLRSLMPATGRQRRSFPINRHRACGSTLGGPGLCDEDVLPDHGQVSDQRQRFIAADMAVGLLGGVQSRRKSSIKSSRLSDRQKRGAAPDDGAPSPELVDLLCRVTGGDGGVGTIGGPAMRTSTASVVWQLSTTAIAAGMDFQRRGPSLRSPAG